jgi:transcriptional regulator with XRE-family HTH domain
MCDYRTMSGDEEWTDVGERLRVARLAAGLTQEELGAKTALDRTMIVKIESGHRRIDAMELIRLSSALQVPVDFLLRPTPLVLSHRTSAMTEDVETEVARESGRLDLALVAWLHDVQQMVELTIFNCGSYWRGVRSSLGLARKPSSRPGRYCIRRSRVLTSTVS